MRSFVSGWLWLCAGGLWACSDEGSSAQQGEGMLQPGVRVETAAGVGGSAGRSGSAGASSSSDALTESGGAAGSEGPNSEGVDVVGLVEPMGSSGETGSSSGDDVRADAGAPPATQGVCPPGPFAGSPLPAAPALMQVCTGMTFTEGAVWFAERGTLFFSDFALGNPSIGRILRYTPGAGCEEFIADAGTNGLAIAPDGNLLGCRHADQTLTIFDLTTRQPTVLVADNDGAAFNSPNDVAVRSDGNLYFTDPNFLLGGRPSEQPVRAYRRDPSGALSVIDENGNTNGISLSPDERRLYLSHLGGPGNIIVFDVDDAGAVSNPQPFAGVGSDGMAVDCAGNLYITQGGVQVFSPAGELLGRLNVPGAANVAFGGAERRTLYITAGASLFAVELAIPGLPY